MLTPELPRLRLLRKGDSLDARIGIDAVQKRPVSGPYSESSYLFERLECVDPNWFVLPVRRPSPKEFSRK